MDPILNLGKPRQNKKQLPQNQEARELGSRALGQSCPAGQSPLGVYWLHPVTSLPHPENGVPVTPRHEQCGVRLET